MRCRCSERRPGPLCAYWVTIQPRHHRLDCLVVTDIEFDAQSSATTSLDLSDGALRGHVLGLGLGLEFLKCGSSIAEELGMPVESRLNGGLTGVRLRLFAATGL